MKQTAVETLIEIYYGNEGQLTIKDLEQAKAMERSQKAEEYLKGFKDGKEYQIKLDELTFKSE